jgi:hypothetical protein
MTLDEAISGLASAPKDIRVKCPNDHFVADMMLSVIDGHLTLRNCRSKSDLRRRRAEEKPALYVHLHVSADRSTVLRCRDKYCGYAGRRNEMQLALEFG